MPDQPIGLGVIAGEHSGAHLEQICFGRGVGGLTRIAGPERFLVELQPLDKASTDQSTQAAKPEPDKTDVQLPDFSPWQHFVRRLNERYDPRHEHPRKEGVPLNPYRLVDRVFQNLRPSDVVACGNASACILPFQMGRLQRGNRLFSNSGSASMGYDLPAAIGAACAEKGRRVICFAGDGSLQMNVQELQTLKTLQLPVIVIVLNNAGYLSIWQTHENFFGRVIGATPATGVEFPDYEALAKASFPERSTE